jgi:integrase
MSKLTMKSVNKELQEGPAQGKKVRKVSLGDSLFLIIRRRGCGFYVGQHRAPGLSEGGKPKFTSIGLGSTSDTTLTEARDRWRVMQAERRQARRQGFARDQSKPGRAATAVTGPLFADAVHEYITKFLTNGTGWRGGATGKTARQWAKLALAPKLASLTWPQLTDDVIRLHVKDLKPKPGRVAEGRIKAVRHMMETGDIKAKAPKPVNHPSLPWRELPRLFEEIAGVDNEKSKALQFIILTGVRSGEVLGGYDKRPATWAEIEDRASEGLVWKVTAERMKAGEEHDVPLTPTMLSLLGSRGAPDVPLFKITQNPVYEFLKSFGRLDPQQSKPVTIHGFRSTFKTWCGDNAICDRELSELCLAHKIGNQVEQSYNRSTYLARRREVMEQWSAFCKSRT